MLAGIEDVSTDQRRAKHIIDQIDFHKDPEEYANGLDFGDGISYYPWLLYGMFIGLLHGS